METYLRFQTPLRCEYTTRPLGIFIAAGRVEASLDNDDALRALIGDLLDWFGEHLHMPDLNYFGWRSLFWFRSDSHTMLAKMWQLVIAIRECGLPVQMQRTSNPGRIVYVDEHQVAAVARRGERSPRRSWSALRV